MDMSDLERLIAIEEIKKLKSRRDRALDAKDWETFGALHAVDHVSANDGLPPRHGRDNLVQSARADLAGMSTVHQCHTPDITIESRDKASAIWYLEDQLYWRQGDREHWIRGFGFYHERCVRIDGAWLFNYRRLERTLLIASPGAEHAAITAARAGGVYRDAG